MVELVVTNSARTTGDAAVVKRSGNPANVSLDVLAHLDTLASSRILGRVTASTGEVEDLTAAQVRTLLNVADGATANAGTVTSVAISAGDGLEVDSGSPITSSGTIALGVNKASMLTFLNVEDGADVTDEANVVSSLSGATLTAATVATGDKVLVQDADDADNLKTVTAQSIADLASGGSGTARKFTSVDAASTTSTLGTGIANHLVEATGTITLTLPASLTDGVGASFVIANVGTGVVTVSAGTDGINRAGNDSFTLAQDEWVEIVYASASDPKWTARISETLTLAANQYSTLDSAGTSPEARTDKRCMTGSIVTDTNATYSLGFIPFAGVATNVRAKTVSGTCSIVVSKNGTAINGFGSPVAITSTAGDTASTETFAADDEITVTTSSASTLTGVVLSLEFTRTGN